MSSLLEKQEARLARLEAEFTGMFALENQPWHGHGGTPFITDNSKGRRNLRDREKFDEKARRYQRLIKEQKEKISRTIGRQQRQATPTKKSLAVVDKHGIHPGLFHLAQLGKVKQWGRNPHLFFVVGLPKVALMTHAGRIGINAKYGTRDEAHKEVCQRLIDEALAFEAE